VPRRRRPASGPGCSPVLMFESRNLLWILHIPMGLCAVVCLGFETHCPRIMHSADYLRDPMVVSIQIFQESKLFCVCGGGGEVSCRWGLGTVSIYFCKNDGVFTTPSITKSNVFSFRVPFFFVSVFFRDRFCAKQTTLKIMRGVGRWPFGAPPRCSVCGSLSQTPP